MTDVAARSTQSSPSTDKIPPLIAFAMAALFAVYAIQLRSPLRINTDASAILRLTANLTDGQPYLLNGVRPLYPIGMPLTYSLMERAGVANAVGFALLNLICICAAAYATWIICKAMDLRPATRTAVILISFSNFVLIKHSVLPLTDIPYMAVSLLCIAMLEILPRQQGAAWISVLAGAIFFLVASLLVRRVGVALVPAGIYAIRPPRQQIDSLKTSLTANKMKLLGLAGGSLVILLIGGFVFRKLLYLPDFHFDGSPAAAIKQQLSLRMIDFGELVFNIPAAKLGRLSLVVFLAGPILTALICVGLWRVRRNLHPVHIYFIAYLAIMAIWPYGDARFWLPALPLIALCVIQALEPSKNPCIVRRVVAVYLAYYALTALVASAYTTRITFAGRRFPELYGTGSTRQAYEEAWAGQSYDPSGDGVALIRRYGMVSAPK